MKRRSGFVGFVLPLILVAILVLGWRAPLSRPSGSGEMLYFLVAVALGYPCISVFTGILAVRTGLRWLTVPFVSALGYALARGMNFSMMTGVIFAFWGAVVTICAIIYAIRMYAEGRW